MNSEPAEPAPAEPRGMPPVTGLVLLVNALLYGGLVLLEGGFDISVKTIAAFGGLLPLEWMHDQYWRVLSYGFLHFSVMHILFNSVCLLAWGVPLERHLGSSRLAALYLGGIVLAGLGSIALHPDPFVSAGASGGVSGLLGALFLFWLLGRLALPASFFVINLGLNVAFPLFVPGIDWQAHLAGFAGGMVLGRLLMPQRTSKSA